MPFLKEDGRRMLDCAVFILLVTIVIIALSIFVVPAVQSYWGKMAEAIFLRK